MTKTPASLLERAQDVEKYFLEGRHNRGEDLASAVRIFMEFIRGFESFEFDRPVVTVFGSARFTEEHPYYMMARKLGNRLAEEGFATLSGGGPGIMEAVNRGAKEAGGVSVGCNIQLPREEKANPYVDHFVEFDHFFVRKVMLVKYSSAFVVMPGGFGTLDEVFETLTLIQTGKIESFPIVAMGQKYWDTLRDFIRETLIVEKTISPEDLDLIRTTDSIDHALEIIRDGHPNCAT